MPNCVCHVPLSQALGPPHRQGFRMQKRIATALTITLALEVLLSGGATASLGSLNPVQSLLVAGLVAFLAVLAGSLIAKSDFIRPSLVLWAVFSMVTMGIAYNIGRTYPGHMSIVELILFNWQVLLTTLFATLAAAVFGTALRTRFGIVPT